MHTHVWQHTTHGGQHHTHVVCDYTHKQPLTQQKLGHRCIEVVVQDNTIVVSKVTHTSP